MAQNYPGEYAVEIIYSVGGLTHKALISCDVSGTPSVGDAPSTIDLLTKGGGVTPLDTAVNVYVTLLQPLFSTTVDFVKFEFWKYAPLSYDRTWITDGTLGLNGTNAGAYAPAKYRKFSFRTLAGGVAYLTLLESIVDGNLQESYPFASPASNAIANYAVGGTSWMKARDNSFFSTPILLSDGQNEVLFRKRYRT